jgi:hypothetical protein
MKQYFFFSKLDLIKEPISKTTAWNRYKAALYFAKVKQMSLKTFLQCYGVSS